MNLLHTHKPRCLILDLTRRCNMRCPGCIFLLYDQDYFSNEDLNLEKAKNIIHYYANQGISELYLTAEGEFFLYRDSRDLLEFSRSVGFKKIHLNTNGSLLEQYVNIIIDNVDSIYISVDGYDRQSYESHRGIDAFEKVIKNIQALIATRNGKRSKLQVSIACVIYVEKLSSISKMIELAEQLEVDRIEFYNFHNPNPIEDLDDFTALERDTYNLFGFYREIVRNTNYNLEIVLPAPLQGQKSLYFCENLFDYVTIGAREDFSPCCRIPPELKYGNFNENPESYTSDQILEFKKNFSRASSLQDLAKPCRKCQGLSSETYIYFPQEQVWKKRWLIDFNTPAYEHLNLDKEEKGQENIDWMSLTIHNNEYSRLTSELEEKEKVIQAQSKSLQQYQQRNIEQEVIIQQLESQKNANSNIEDRIIKLFKRAKDRCT